MWNCQNKLGHILMEVQDYLWSEQENTTQHDTQKLEPESKLGPHNLKDSNEEGQK